MIWRWLVESLKSKSVRELVALARKWGVTGYSRLKKAELVKLLSRKLIEQPRKKLAGKKKETSGKKTKPDARRARQAASRARASKPAVKTPPRSTPAKKVKPKGTAGGKDTAGRAATRSPELPPSYGDGAMVLMARDPHWLYVYWDPTEEQARRLERSDALLLRVMETGKSSRACEIGRVPVPDTARSWYLQVDTSGGQFRAELGIPRDRGRFQVIMASNPASTPRESNTKDEVAFGRFSPGRPPEPALAPPRSSNIHTDRLYALSAGEVEEGMDSARAHRARRGISSSDLQPRTLGRPGRT